MSRYSTTSLAAVLLISLATNSYAEETLKIATEGFYPPFNYTNASGELVGFDIDIGFALCRSMNVKCEFVKQAWDGIIPGLVAKKYDIILASMGITEERKAIVSFTDPYYKPAIVYVVPKNSDIQEFTADGLKGKTIGVQSDTTQAKFAEETFPGSEVKQYQTQDEVNLDLSSGRLDLQISDLLPMKDWVAKTPEGSCCEIRGKYITDPKIVGEGIGIAVRHEDVGLREQLNKAIAAIRADGTYKQINNKYFDIDIYTME